MNTNATDASTGHDLQIAADLFATSHRYLWHPATSTAVLADLHLGIEEAWLKQGLAIPGVLPAYIPPLTRAWATLAARNPARVIIAGDLFDAPEPSDAAVDLCRRLFRALPAACRIIITPGNHDPDAETLAGIFAGLPVSICDHFRLADHIIFHGHTRCTGAPDGNPGPSRAIPASAAKLHGFWIVGHQHPAVAMRSRIHGRGIKMPCFATAATHILLPAFSRGPLGCNLLNESHWLLPIPRPDDRNIRIAGLIEPEDSRDPQILDFGPLSMLG